MPCINWPTSELEVSYPIIAHVSHTMLWFLGGSFPERKSFLHTAMELKLWFLELRTGLRNLGLLGKCPTTELRPEPWNFWGYYEMDAGYPWLKRPGNGCWFCTAEVNCTCFVRYHSSNPLTGSSWFLGKTGGEIMLLCKTESNFFPLCFSLLVLAFFFFLNIRMVSCYAT